MAKGRHMNEKKNKLEEMVKEQDQNGDSDNISQVPVLQQGINFMTHGYFARTLCTNAFHFHNKQEVNILA